MSRVIRERIIVKLRDFAAAAQTLADCGVFEWHSEMAGAGILLVKVPEGQDPAALLATVSAHRNVAYALFDSEATPTGYAAPVTDTFAASPGQHWMLGWHLARSNFYRAWRETKGAGAGVFVVDTGSLPHPDAPTIAVENQIDLDSDPVTNDASEDPGGIGIIGHGAMVLGQIFSPHNGRGVAGMAPEATPGACSNFSTYYNFKAMEWAAERGFRIATNSWEREIAGVPEMECPWDLSSPGSYGSDLSAYSNPELRFTIDSLLYIQSLGMLVVAAAGNSYLSLDHYAHAPASLAGVLTVAALAPDNSKIEFSNFGDTVEIAAPTYVGAPFYPGQVIGSDNTKYPKFADYGATYWSGTGTSSACPVVASACSLVWSMNPALTAQEVHDIVVRTASPFLGPRDLVTTIFGWANWTPDPEKSLPGRGVVNAGKGVLAAKATVPANAGQIFPYIGFLTKNWLQGDTAFKRVDDASGTAGGSTVPYAGAQTVHFTKDGSGNVTVALSGAVWIELAGYSNDEVTSVELWANGVKIHDHAGSHVVLECSAQNSGANIPIKVVARTAGAFAEETYTDIAVSALSVVNPCLSIAAAPAVGHAVAVSGQKPANETVAISTGGIWGDGTAVPGAVSYPAGIAGTSWACTVTDLPAGRSTITANAATQRISARVETLCLWKVGEGLDGYLFGRRRRNEPVVVAGADGDLSYPDPATWLWKPTSLAAGANNLTVSDSVDSLTVEVQGAGLDVEIPAEDAIVSFPIAASGSAIPGELVQVFNDDTGEMLAETTAHATSGAWTMQIGHA